MNTQRDNFNQEDHLNQENTLNNKKIWEMEEELEILREQVDSLKQVLCHEYKLTNEYIQELAYTKQELDWMNEEISNLVASNKKPIYEVKELDQRIVEENSISESITKSIDPIARSPVKVNESEEAEYSVVRSRSDKFKAQSREIRNHSDQIISQSTQITAQSDKITNRSREIKVHAQEVRKRLARLKVARNAS
jgi:regulator of replication initiation timing